MSLKFPQVLLFLTLFSFINSLFGQETGNSPYSTIGIGIPTNVGNIRNAGMNLPGVGSPHPEFINISNPALLPVNKFFNRDSTLKYTMLDVSFTGVFRRLSNNSGSQQNAGANFNYFLFAVPLSDHWTTSVGLRPFSSVSHKYISTQYLGTIPYNIEDEYKGGINIVNFSNGYDISKNLSIGLTAAYLFGNINEDKIIQTYLDQQELVSSGFQKRIFYSGFQLKPGIAFRSQLTDSAGRDNGIFLNIGAAFEFLPVVREKTTKDIITKGTSGAVYIVDSTQQSVSYRNPQFPQQLSYGISLQKPDYWNLSLEVNHGFWKDNDFGLEKPRLVNYKNSYSVSLGAEIKPGAEKALTSREYRMGFQYAKLPVTFNGTQLNDYSLSIGSTIPLGRKDARYKSKPLTKINIALVGGIRGTTEMGLVKEQYLRIYLSALIHDKWFQRWKID